MTNRNIGRVITISSKWIVAELYPNSQDHCNHRSLPRSPGCLPAEASIIGYGCLVLAPELHGNVLIAKVITAVV